MITTFNKAVTETASETLGKHCQKKIKTRGHCRNSWSVRQKGRTEKERLWTRIGDQYSEIEENLRKNNSKRTYQLVKDLTTVKQGKATTVQDRSGKCLTEEREILNRWTEYCTELYNHKANGDPSVLGCPQTDTEGDHPILRKKVEAAVQSLKRGKSAGVDNIPAELDQAGGEDVITALTTICNKIWQTGEWPTPCTQSLVITLPKKGNLQQCQNCRTISLISHPSKSCWRACWTDWSHKLRRSSLKNRLLCEKYLQYQQDLYHVFVDFKKAFDEIWHAVLWATMKKYNISTNLIRVIKNLYNKATSAVLFNSSTGSWFRTTVGVRQGCLLSPTLFNICLERIMTDTLEDLEGSVSIGGRTITNLRFDDCQYPARIVLKYFSKCAEHGTTCSQRIRWDAPELQPLLEGYRLSHLL